MRAQSGNVDSNGDIVDEAHEARDYVLDLRRRLESATCIDDPGQRDAHLEAIAAEIDRARRRADTRVS